MPSSNDINDELQFKIQRIELMVNAHRDGDVVRAVEAHDLLNAIGDGEGDAVAVETPVGVDGPAAPIDRPVGPVNLHE